MTSKRRAINLSWFFINQQEINIATYGKAYSGPLVKIIVLLSVCKASSLTTSLKSINVNVRRVFQRLGSVGLCWHNFEHNTISGASGIMLAWY